MFSISSIFLQLETILITNRKKSTFLELKLDDRPEAHLFNTLTKHGFVIPRISKKPL